MTLCEYNHNNLKMSSKNSQKLEDSRERVLHIIKTEFSSNAEFCREFDLSHNWVNYFKKADDPTVSDRLISRFYESKKISPLWITNNEGPYKISGENFRNVAKVAEESPGYMAAGFAKALEAIERIEQQPGDIKDMPLPPDLELRLARLLTKLLEHRFETNRDKD